MADPGNYSFISNPVSVNPLAAMTQGLQAARLQNENALFQAKRATGQAFQASIGQDGLPNQAAFMTGLKSDPSAALYAQEGAQAGQQLSADQFKLASAKNAWVNNAASAILDKKDPSMADVMGIFQQGSASGMLTPQEIKREMSTLPNDPAGIQDWARQHQLRALSSQDQLNQIYGTTYTQNQGGAIAAGVQQPASKGGGQAASTATPVTMSPEQSNTITQVPYPQFLDDGKTPNPNYGKTFPMRQGDLVKLLPGATTPGGSPAVGSVQGLPASLRNPARAAVPGVAGGPPAAPTSIGTTPSAADINLQTHTAEQGAQGFQAISDQAVQARSQGATLGNMLADTTQFTTGPLAGVKERIRNMAMQLGVKGDVEAQTAQESFTKLAAQLANSQGAGSDARLNVNVAANPHQELSPAGVDQMIRQLQGNADYLQARGKLGAAYGDQKNVKGFEQEIGAKLDPRAFQFARMTQPQRQTYVKGLSETDRKAVQNSYNFAYQQGLIQ